MPKVEKDPTPESDGPEVILTDGENTTLEGDTGLNVGKAVKQQLDSLRRSGLTCLPKGTGQYDFSFDEPPPEIAPQKSPSRLPNQRETVAKSKIEESKSEYSSNLPQPLNPNTEPSRVDSTPTIAAKNKLASVQSKSVDLRPYATPLGLAERQTALQVLQEEVAGCVQCEELADSRNQTVFGVGNPNARLVFLGEGPGANEDRLGEPFVGEAGQLLDKIMGACKLTRSDVYILNTVKCRPPANRNPSQIELANCWGYAEKQLETLQPEFICCLGSVAARTLLKTTQSIGRLRRQFHSYRGSRVLVTYHPAYLLRTPSAKKHVWEDMQLLMKEMGVDLSN
ncbi:MAG: uracil-DNA glycosylase [Mariniblastus sp.]|nr:uracil-DNA glycosylase [Mariniblastus sp.]